VIASPNPTPIFGICLGNQLLALAAGCTTFKMKCATVL
jgi:carbamoylphosphate synthase small subunit